MILLDAVFVLLDEPVSVAEFDSLVEVGQILVDADLVRRDCVTPFLHPSEEAKADHYDYHEGQGKQKHRSCLVKISQRAPIVRTGHLFCRVFNLIDNVLKYLPV